MRRRTRFTTDDPATPAQAASEAGQSDAVTSAAFSLSSRRRPAVHRCLDRVERLDERRADAAPVGEFRRRLVDPVALQMVLIALTGWLRLSGAGIHRRQHLDLGESSTWTLTPPPIGTPSTVGCTPPI